MKVFFILISISLINFSTCWGQDKKSIREQVKEDVAVLSSKDYPYIDKFHQAVRAKLANNYKEAKALFLECIEMRQDDDAAYFGLAEIAEDKHNFHYALINYRKAYEINPANFVYLRRLAYINYKKGDFEEALPLFEAICEKRPKNVDFRYGYIKVLVYNKEYKKAIEQVDILQEQTGIVPQIMIIKADLLSELNNKKEAASTIEKLRSSFPGNTKVLNQIIDFYKKRDQKDKIKPLLEKMVQDNPKNSAAQFALAEFYIQQEKKDELVGIAPIIFERKDIAIQNKLVVFNQLKEYKNPDDPMMISITQKLYEDYPNNGAVVMNYGRVLLAQNDVVKALSVIRKIITDNLSSDYSDWAKILYFEWKYKEYNALYEDGKKGVTRFPTQPYMYYLAAGGALLTGHPEEAKEFIDAGEIYVLGNKQYQAQLNLRKGQLHFYHKAYKKGIVAFEKAITYPSDNIKISYATELLKANIAQDVAIELLAKIDPKNKNEQYYRAIGMLYMQREEFDKGIELVKVGIENNHHSVELIDLLGDLYFNSGNEEKAVKTWKEALAKGSKNKNIEKKINEIKYYAPVYY